MDLNSDEPSEFGTAWIMQNARKDDSVPDTPNPNDHDPTTSVWNMTTVQQFLFGSRLSRAPSERKCKSTRVQEHLPGLWKFPWESNYNISLPDNLSHQQLLEFPAFVDWHKATLHALALQSYPDHPFHAQPYRLRGIDVQSADWFTSERLGFVKLKAEITTDAGEWIPGAVFLRGGSVGILVCSSHPHPRDAKLAENDDHSNDFFLSRERILLLAGIQGAHCIRIVHHCSLVQIPALYHYENHIKIRR